MFSDKQLADGAILLHVIGKKGLTGYLLEGMKEGGKKRDDREVCNERKKKRRFN